MSASKRVGIQTCLPGGAHNKHPNLFIPEKALTNTNYTQGQHNIVIGSSLRRLIRPLLSSAETDETAVLCIFCGFKLSSAARYCRKCGREQLLGRSLLNAWLRRCVFCEALVTFRVSCGIEGTYSNLRREFWEIRANESGERSPTGSQIEVMNGFRGPLPSNLCPITLG